MNHEQDPLNSNKKTTESQPQPHKKKAISPEESARQHHQQKTAMSSPAQQQRSTQQRSAQQGAAQQETTQQNAVQKGAAQNNTTQKAAAGDQGQKSEKQLRKEAKRKEKIRKKKEKLEWYMGLAWWQRFLLRTGQWLLKMILILVCLVAASIAGLVFGMGVIGDGSPGDALDPDTWRHLFQLMFPD